MVEKAIGEIREVREVREISDFIPKFPKLLKFLNLPSSHRSPLQKKVAWRVRRVLAMLPMFAVLRKLL